MRFWNDTTPSVWTAYRWKKIFQNVDQWWYYDRSITADWLQFLADSAGVPAWAVFAFYELSDMSMHLIRHGLVFSIWSAMRTVDLLQSDFKSVQYVHVCFSVFESAVVDIRLLQGDTRILLCVPLCQGGLCLCLVKPC